MSDWNRGFTLIEVLFAVGVLALAVSFAIPQYNHHVKETQLHVASANARSLRLFMEDYYLTHGSYAIGDEVPYLYDKADLATHFGWRPEGDRDAYQYTVSADADDWSVTVKHTGSGNWVRCENRLTKCCDVDMDGATESACP